MKQSNKLINIFNIQTIIFLVLFIFLSETLKINEILMYLVFFVFINVIFLINICIGTKNILNESKKIGKINIVQAIFMFFIIEIFLMGDMVLFDEIWLYILLIITLSSFVILSIINLILNRKNQDDVKKKYKTNIFLLIVLIEIILIAMPFVIHRINAKQIYNAINIINLQNEKTLIVHQYKQQKFLNEKGELINTTNYDEINSFRYNNKNDLNFINILIAEKDENVYIIDNYGKIIAEIHGKCWEKTQYITAFLKRNNYEYIYINEELKPKYNYFEVLSKNNIPIVQEMNEGVLTDVENDKSKIKYIFGNYLDSDCRLIVELDKNIIEDTSNIYKNYLNILEEDMFYLEEKYNELQDLYKYKKYYYIEKRNGEKIELDCKNLIFTLTPELNNIAILIYENGYIPYYDYEASGYFDLEGNKVEIDDKYVVYDIKEKYKILYDIEEKCYRIVTKYGEVYYEKIENIIYNDDNYIITEDENYRVNTIYTTLYNDIRKIEEDYETTMVNYFEKNVSPFEYIGIVE